MTERHEGRRINLIGTAIQDPGTKPCKRTLAGEGQPGQGHTATFTKRRSCPSGCPAPGALKVDALVHHLVQPDAKAESGEMELVKHRPCVLERKAALIESTDHVRQGLDHRIPPARVLGTPGAFHHDPSKPVTQILKMGVAQRVVEDVAAQWQIPP